MTTTNLATDAGPQKAEQMFNAVGHDYESVYAEHSNHLLDVLKYVATLIPASSRVIDIGSGTGKPTAAFFTEQGHQVTGLDISQTMVEVARRQVPKAEFYKADVRVYEPPSGVQYDALIASHSLYQFSLPALRSQVLKFSGWMKKGGIVAIGTNLKTAEMAEQNRTYDHRGWVEAMTERFMGHQAKCTIGLPEAWSRLLRDCGLEVLNVNRRTCQPLGGADSDRQDQFFVIGRKNVDNVLLGPYPLPVQPQQSFYITTNNREAWTEFFHRIKREDLQAVHKILKASGSQKVLCVGPGALDLAHLLQQQCSSIYCIELAGDIEGFPARNVTMVKGSIERLPFAPNTFDAVVSLWSLQYTHFLRGALEEILRVASQSATIVLVQAAPDNELINLMNDALRDVKSSCSPRAPVHQGKMLATAETVFQEVGLSKFSFVPITGSIQFHDAGSDDEMINIAAELLAKIWCGDESLQREVKGKLFESLTVHFGDRPGEIGCQGVLMVAQRE